MSLNWIKRLLGMDPSSGDTDVFLKGVKDKREARALLAEHRRADEDRRQRALLDIDVLAAREKEVFDLAKDESSEAKKMILVKRIKDIRAKIADINNKVAIYDKRIKIYGTHIQNLDVIIEAQVEDLPDKESLEKGALVARTEMDRLNEAAMAAEGMGVSLEKPTLDAAEQEILAEVNAAVENEIDATDPLLAEIEASKAEDAKKATEAPAAAPAAAPERPKEEAKKADVEKQLEG